MVRFIFFCMAVVALSFVTLGAQSVMDSMSDEQNSVLARNAEQQNQPSEIASTEAQTETNIAQDLNDINTAAGALGHDDFGSAFTNAPQKGLEDNLIVQPLNDVKQNIETIEQN